MSAGRFDPEDYTAARDMLEGLLDFEPTDDQIAQAVRNTGISAHIRAWGWGDTENRAEIAFELEVLTGRRP